MQEFDCPSCKASLIVGQCGDSCPFCGEDISRFAHAQPPQPSTAPTASSQPSSATGSSDVCFDESQLPSKTFLRVNRQSSQQAVIEIRPGGPRSKGILFFAVLWNIIVYSILTVFLLAAKDGDNEVWVAFAFISLFVLVGLFLGWMALRMSFIRTFVLLEPGRLAVQTSIFGRKKIRQYAIDDSCEARLVVAYEQNEEPVYRVDIETPDGTAKLATALSLSEKQWLARGINQFITGETVADQELPTELQNPLDITGALSGSTAESIETSEIATDSALRIDCDDGEVLRFSWPVFPPGPARTVVTLILGAFGAFFALLGGTAGISALVDAIQKGDLLQTLVALPFLAIGLFPLFILGVIRRGRTAVRMDRQRIKLSIGWWLVQFSRSFLLENVQDVIIADPKSTGSVATGTGRSRRQVALGCVLKVTGAKSPIPLTVGQDLATAKQIGGLIHSHILKLGYRLNPAASGQPDFEQAPNEG